VVVVVGVILLISFAAIMVCWHHSRARSILDDWARENGFQILSQESCLFFRGPFFWTTAKGQEVYRVVVRDDTGRTRSGYVRCGSRWVGMLSDQIEVRWDR